MIPLMNFFSRL